MNELFVHQINMQVDVFWKSYIIICFICHSSIYTTNVFYLFSLIAACINSPCLNGGICELTDTGFECMCPAEYTGTTCDTGKHYLILNLQAIDHSM